MEDTRETNASREASQHHVYSHPSRVEHWRHLVEIIALVVAAAWGFYVFIYQEHIKPSNELPNLEFHADIQHEYLVGNRVLVKLSYTWHNLGSSAAQIDGVAANMYGITYGDFGDRLERLPGTPLERGYNQTVLEVRTTARHETLLGTMFHPWRAMGGRLGAELEPGDSITMHALEVVLPRGKFAAVRARVAYCERRINDRQAAHVRIQRLPDGGFDVDSMHSAEARAHLLHPTCTYVGTGQYGL